MYIKPVDTRTNKFSLAVVAVHDDIDAFMQELLRFSFFLSYQIVLHGGTAVSI